MDYEGQLSRAGVSHLYLGIESGLEDVLLFMNKGNTLAEAEKDNPLLALPNFTVTPHIGANTDDALYAVGMACVKQIIDVMEGRAPEYPVE